MIDVRESVPFIAKSIMVYLRANIYLESWIVHTETNFQGNSLFFCKKNTPNHPDLARAVS